MENLAFKVDLLLSAYDGQAADLSLQHSGWAGTACVSLPQPSSAEGSEPKPSLLPGLERLYTQNLSDDPVLSEKSVLLLP